jgi:peptidoglycan hydrolase-like protein with peptidoglycan-binding domain
LLRFVVGVALAATAVGWAAGSHLRSPAEAARYREQPEPSLITAPLELRRLSSTIVVRGDGAFTGATDLTVGAGGDATEGGGQAVVTGALPAVGSELKDGAVAIEVSGRPVFLLAGDLPMYRTLLPGAHGRDVRQFETALARLGFSPGPVDETYDASTTRAVEAWYRASGYDPVGPSDEAGQALTAAENEAQAADDALGTAREALDQAGRPPSRSEVAGAEGEVTVARTARDAAVADRDEAVANAAPANRPRVRREQDILVAEAEARLTTAQAALAELRKPADTTGEQQAVDAATAAQQEAQDALHAAQVAAGPRVPRSEVVFLPDLPRRVDKVAVRVGAEPDGPVMTLSGSEVLVVAHVSPAERQLVEVGDRVRLDEATLGVDLAGTVVGVDDAPAAEGEGAGSYAVRIRPEGGDPAKLTGVNLRVTIPVESTSGKVLAAPVAALSTAADGRSRVRVLGTHARPRDVEVRVGLSAEGYVEIEPLHGAVEAGDEVVLGIS